MATLSCNTHGGRRLHSLLSSSRLLSASWICIHLSLVTRSPLFVPVTFASASVSLAYLIASAETTAFSSPARCFIPICTDFYCYRCHPTVTFSSFSFFSSQVSQHTDLLVVYSKNDTPLGTCQLVLKQTSFISPSSAT